MLSMLFETGHPWITFKDPSNVRSPQDHVGVVHSSNLCTEITLNTSADETAVCNLGSVNLAEHITAGKLDEQKVAQTVAMAMRMLDNVIDINYYPTKEAKHSNMRHRPVGLGIMGLQDALYMLNINFDTDAAVEFSDQLMELVSYHAILTSSKLAGERGAYTSFGGSKWDRGLLPLDTVDLLEKERNQRLEVDRTSRLDWTPVRESIRQHGMRNSNCMAIAPTATIANIAGCFPSTEPIYKNVYVKSNMSGEFVVVNSYLIEDLKQLGLWNQSLLDEIKRKDGDISDIDMIPKALREKHKETFAIDAEWLIRSAAVRAKWIDQSQSINIFLKTTSGKRIGDVYMYAWKAGLKTTYYLRTLAATSIEKSTLELKQETGKPAEEPTRAVEEPVAAGIGHEPAERPRVRSLIEGLMSAAVNSESVRAFAPAMAMAGVSTREGSDSMSLRDSASSVSLRGVKQSDEAISGGVAVAEKPVTKIGEISEAGLKLCAIDDPDCEACQ